VQVPGGSLCQLLRGEWHRHPHFGALCRELQIGGDDPENRVRQAVERDRSADERGIGAEAPSPQTIADQRDRIAAGAVAVVQEHASQDRPDSEEREQVVRHARAGEPLGIAAARQIECLPSGDDLHAFEDAVLILPVLEISRRGFDRCGAAAAAEVFPDDDEAIRIRKRQGPDGDRVYEAEDGGVGADAQRQREDGDGGEGAVLQQHPSGVTDVQSQVREPGTRPDRSHVLLGSRDVAEPAAGGLARLPG
jgi:hypothetical protein